MDKLLSTNEIGSGRLKLLNGIQTNIVRNAIGGSFWR